MTTCPYCGKPVPDTANFCQSCGADLRESIEDDFSDIYEDTDADDTESYSRENRKTVMIGIILAVLICVVGVGLWIIVSNMLKQDSTMEAESGLNNKTVQVTPAPESSTEESAEETELQEEAAAAEITASVTAGVPEMSWEYSQTGYAAAQESSVLEDNGVYHTADLVLDGNEASSWQESSSGDGSGEWIQVQLDREYAVRYLTFKLGNWRNQQLFYANNRPAQILLRVGDREFYIDFPDGMTEYTVELSEDCQASDILIQILSVYQGSSWNDCCISEVSVYGY